MSNRESDDLSPGTDREGHSVSPGKDSGGREGYSEPVRGEQSRGNEELGQPGGTLYGQGRQAEEPWRPGQSEDTEGSSYGPADSTSNTSNASTRGSSAGTSGGSGQSSSSKGGSTTKSSNS